MMRSTGGRVEVISQYARPAAAPPPMRPRTMIVRNRLRRKRPKRESELRFVRERFMVVRQTITVPPGSVKRHFATANAISDDVCNEVPGLRNPCRRK
jgi:hypothetical protein